jgi:hypothetical protein
VRRRGRKVEHKETKDRKNRVRKIAGTQNTISM